MTLCFGTPHRISFLVSSILRLIRETATSWTIVCPEVRKKAPLRYGDQSIIRIACPRRQNRLQVMPTSSESADQAIKPSYRRILSAVASKHPIDRCIPSMNVCNHPCRFAAMEATSQHIVSQTDISSQSVAICWQVCNAWISAYDSTRCRGRY